MWRFASLTSFLGARFSFEIDNCLLKNYIRSKKKKIVQSRKKMNKTKFQKLRTLTGAEKSTKFFAVHTFPTRFFRSVLTPRTMSNSWTCKHKKVFFLQNAIFHFLPFFWIGRSLKLGATKLSLSIAHLPSRWLCHLASHNGIVGFLHTHSTHSDTQVRSEHVRTRLRKHRTCIFPNFTIFTPHFRRYFCIFSVLRFVHRFFSTPNLWFGYRWLCVKLGNIFQYKSKVAKQYPNVFDRRIRRLPIRHFSQFWHKIW